MFAAQPSAHCRHAHIHASGASRLAEPKLVDFLLGEAEELEALSSGVVTTQSAASDAESEEF